MGGGRSKLFVDGGGAAVDREPGPAWPERIVHLHPMGPAADVRAAPNMLLGSDRAFGSMAYV